MAARTASKKTNGTVEMKMNIIFCVSSMPNHRMVSGMSTATGTLRANTDSGRVNASNSRYEPAIMPSGTPTSDGEEEATKHALATWPRCWRPVRVR